MIQQDRMYSPLLNPLYEGCDMNDLCVGTYLIGATKEEEAIVKAASIGIEQTTGSWIDVPEETDEMRAKYCSKIIGIYEVPAFENQTNVDRQVAPDGLRFYVIRIGYPVANIEDNIPLLIGSIMGNIMSMPYLKLLDIDFPKKYVDKFQGPKFGIQGIRDILGIDISYMPKIVKPWDIIGGLTEENAAFTGLPAGTPICGGAGDTMQSMIGCGLTEVNQAADVAGTCAMFCVSTDGIKPELSTPDSGLIFNSGTMENTYFYWGYIRTGGLSLRWYRDNICDKEGDGEYYDLLSEKAKDVPAGSNGVLFLPYLTGGYGDFANASGAFLNMTMDTNQEVLWRAVLEAIGYDYISVTDVYRAGGVSLDKITVTEGGSRSDLWNQIKADMLNSTVTTLKKAGGAVMTNVVVAAYAVGDIDNLKDSFNSWLEVKKVYTPDPENTKYYRSIYNMQNKLVREDMKPTFDMLEKIREYK